MRWLLLLGLVASAAAHAQNSCDQPRPRDTAPLLKAIQDDDAMASMFDQTAGACTTESAACDAQKLKCGDQLAETLKRQVNVDNGAWLRDMLIPFLGQRYTPSAQIPTTEIAYDVSCSMDAAQLKAAATRRRQLAQRRRDIVNEYPKWAMWAAGIAQKCKTDSAAMAKEQASAAATAKAQADAAAAARAAEEQRQENQRKLEQAAKDKAEAEKRAKEDAQRAEQEKIERQRKEQEEIFRRQQEAIAEQQRKEREARMTEEERRAEARRREEEEKRRKAEEAERARLEAEEQKKREALEAEERRKRELQEAADAKFVAEREGKKLSAEKKAEELRKAEMLRREAYEQQLAAYEEIDRSDERLKGSMGVQLQGGYGAVGPNSGLLVGALIQIRYGLWMTAPADGLASGLELKVNGSFLGMAAGQGGFQYFSATPELRWFIARVGFGASFEWRRLVTTLPTTDPLDTYAAGINVAFAIVDTPHSRFIIGARWLPAFFGRNPEFAPDRFSGEIEIGHKWFFANVQGGTVNVRNSAASSNTIGGFVSAGIGARLRF